MFMKCHETSEGMVRKSGCQASECISSNCKPKWNKEAGCCVDLAEITPAALAEGTLLHSALGFCMISESLTANHQESLRLWLDGQAISYQMSMSTMVPYISCFGISIGYSVVLASACVCFALPMLL